MNEIYKILEKIRPSGDFKNSKNFIEDGLLDSFDLVCLVENIKNKYKIKVDPEKILINNFITVDSIINLIKSCGGKV